MQSCSGGRIGNFLESSFNDLEKISQDEDFQKNLEKPKSVLENKKINEKNNEKRKKIEKSKSVLENKKINEKNNEKRKKIEKPKSVLENKKINEKNNEKRKKIEKSKSVLENKKEINSEKIQKQKNNKIKNSSKKRKIELQSYKIIFILKDVDPKDPTEELSTILSDSEVNFEIEKIERILDSKNKIMNKN
nr:hypothetical protein [Prochlorococcus marinus]